MDHANSWQFHGLPRRTVVIGVAIAVGTLVAYQSLGAGSPGSDAVDATVEIKSLEDLERLASGAIEQANQAKQWKGYLIHSSVRLRGHARSAEKGSDWLTTNFASFYLYERWPDSIVPELPRTTSIVEVRAKLWWYPAYVLDESAKFRQGEFPPDRKMPERYLLRDVEILDASEAGPVPIRARNIGRSVEIIGDLGVPLGTPVDLEGTWNLLSRGGAEELEFEVDHILIEDEERRPVASYEVAEVKPAIHGLEITPRKGTRWKMRAYEMGYMSGMSSAVKKELGADDKKIPRMAFSTTLRVISCNPVDRSSD